MYYIKSVVINIDTILKQNSFGIKLFGNNSARHVWSKEICVYDPRNTIPILRCRGGSIMIWG